MVYDHRYHGDIFSEVPKLGFQVTEQSIDPWEVDRSLTEPFSELAFDNAKFNLSIDERIFVQTGDATNPSDTNRNVLQKRDRLPIRIQSLIDDINLFESRDFFSDENWESGLIEGPVRQSPSPAQRMQGIEEISKYESPFEDHEDLWENLKDVEPRGWKYRDDVFLREELILSDEVKLGFEIGNVLRFLMQGAKGNSVPADLIWGFTLAFIGESTEHIADQEYDQLTELIDQFESRHERRREEATMVDKFDHDKSYDNPEAELAREGIREVGVTPHPTVVREVLFHQNTVTDDEDRFREDARRITENIVDIVPLQEVDKLANIVEKDIEIVREQGAMGVDSSRPVIRVLWEIEQGTFESDAEDSGVEESNDEDEGEQGDEEDTRERVGIKRTSKNIGSELGERSSSVSRVLNILSTDEDSDTITEHPLVTERRGEWELTEYGLVVANTTFARNDRVRWIYRFAIGPEELTLFERKAILDSLYDIDIIK